jgi:hypothetical protein
MTFKNDVANERSTIAEKVGRERKGKKRQTPFQTNGASKSETKTNVRKEKAKDSFRRRKASA